MRLANDLRNRGLGVWLDKWEIKVGDDIFDKIQHGIRDSEYVILVLSRNSISSGWVDKEWKMVYWDEINSRKVRLLPVLLEDCEIPEFLKFKKYADFRKEYDYALGELLKPLKSIVTSPNKKEVRKVIPRVPKLQIFKEAYNFAVSYTGMSLSTREAKEFALQKLID